MIRNLIVFSILLVVKTLSRIFYRFDQDWLNPPTRRDWDEVRLIVVLHHTSLMEPLYFGLVPVRVLWRVACHGLAPAAAVTTERRFVGFAFRTMARNVVAVTRKRDHTWKRLLDGLSDPETLVIIAPEGQMMRSNGLDKKGRPMTVRGGVAEVMQGMPGGRMLMIYSGGLHHIQKPGEQRFPHLFKRVCARFEMLDLPTYRRELLDRHGEDGFKQAVIEDLTRRRDKHCPRTGFSAADRS